MQYNSPQLTLLRRDPGRPSTVQKQSHPFLAPMGVRELNTNDDALLDTEAASRRVYVGRLGGACATESFLKDQIFEGFTV